MNAKQWNVEIFLAENGDETSARAVLHGSSAQSIVGNGFARRNPHDPSVPEVGDELAAGRALEALSRTLLRIAETDIDAIATEDTRIR